jgi:hypothetical protein
MKALPRIPLKLELSVRSTIKKGCLKKQPSNLREISTHGEKETTEFKVLI